MVLRGTPSVRRAPRPRCVRTPAGLISQIPETGTRSALGPEPWHATMRAAPSRAHSDEGEMLGGTPRNGQWRRRGILCAWSVRATDELAGSGRISAVFRRELRLAVTQHCSS